MLKRPRPDKTTWSAESRAHNHKLEGELLAYWEARVRTCCYVVFGKLLCRDCAERPSADHLKSGFREVPIEGKRHANTPIGHQDKAHGVDGRELVQIGPFEILPSMLEV